MWSWRNQCLYCMPALDPKKKPRYMSKGPNVEWKNAMKQTNKPFEMSTTNQQSTFFITITSRHATTSISPKKVLLSLHLFAIQKHFQTSWVSIYMSFFRLQKVDASMLVATRWPKLTLPPVACANARWRRKASRVSGGIQDDGWKLPVGTIYLWACCPNKPDPAVNGVECHLDLDDLLAK